MNAKLFLLLFVSLFVPIVSAYSVNESMTLSVPVQYDDGLSISNVSSSVCRLSVFIVDSFVFRNVSMSPSGVYHSYSFTPSVSGDYVASVYCSYLGDSSLYYFDFSVSPAVVPSSTGGSGRGIVSTSLIPESSSFDVVLSDSSRLKFLSTYTVNGVLSSGVSASWKVTVDSNVVDSGLLSKDSAGEYVFNYDFRSLGVGEYNVVLSVDGSLVVVPVSVSKGLSGDLSLISGAVTYDNGELSILKIGGLLLLVMIFIMAFVWFFKSINKKPPTQRPIARREY